MSADDKKVIYSMYRVSKKQGPKQVLKDISLSYFYGAKIGLIGLNGSGKSSLLRILAGVDPDFSGEISVSPGYTIGYLEQEPRLEPGKTVKELVSEGVQGVVDQLREFDAVSEAFGEPDADYEKLGSRQAALQEQIEAADMITGEVHRNGNGFDGLVCGRDGGPGRGRSGPGFQAPGTLGGSVRK